MPLADGVVHDDAWTAVVGDLQLLQRVPLEHMKEVLTAEVEG